MNFGRGGEQAARHGVGQIPVEFRRGVWHAGLALHGERKQWMRGAGRGPGVFACAEEPDGVGGEARGLGGAGNQNRRVLRLGRKKRFIHSAIERGKKIGPRHAAAIKAERSAVVDGLLPAAERLKFSARERSRAGPAGDLEQLRHKLGPGKRSLRLAREFLQPLSGLRHARGPLGGQLGARHAGAEMSASVQRVSLQAATAQRAHESGERARFVGRSGDLAGREQPIKLVFSDGVAEPAQAATARSAPARLG